MPASKLTVAHAVAVLRGRSKGDLVREMKERESLPKNADFAQGAEAQRRFIEAMKATLKPSKRVKKKKAA